jgi:hypothetical protein
MTHTRRALSLLLLSTLTLAATAHRVVQRTFDEPDTSTLDVAIAKAEVKASVRGATAAEKRTAAGLLLERGNVYYNAQMPRLYKFALADFRRALEYQPDLAEAREKAEQIIDIYRSLDRPIPTNVSEPAETLNKAIAGARRVEIKGAQSSATIRGVVEAGATKDYVIKGGTGRSYTVSVHADKHRVHFFFYRVLDGIPIRLALDTDEWSGEIKQAGDYLIRLGSVGRKTPFTLEVKANKPGETRKF